MSVIIYNNWCPNISSKEIVKLVTENWDEIFLTKTISKNTFTTTKYCLRCEGSGQVVEDSAPGCPVESDCSACNGKGRVKRE